MEGYNENETYGDYTGISSDFKEFMENINLDETNKVKDFFNAIDESFDSFEFDPDVESEVIGYLNNYDKELDAIQDFYQAQVDIEKDKLEEFLVSTYGAEGAQMMEKIDSPNGIDTAELERVRQQVEKENEEEARRIEEFQSIVKNLAISVGVVEIVNEEKENFSKIKDKFISRDDYGLDGL